MSEGAWTLALAAIAVLAPLLVIIVIDAALKKGLDALELRTVPELLPIETTQRIR